MTQQEFQTFADNYTSADFDRIKMVWNGKYGNEFADEHYDFRTQLCEFLIPQLDTVKLELIRDLYCETGKSSEMTFGVYINFYLFAQQLLQRGGTEYLLDYIKGASHTMDTAMSSGRISLTKERASELLKYFDSKKATTTDKEELVLLNDLIRKRLEYNANK
jgi:hypothetical protein